MGEKQVNIDVHVAGRKYPVKIKESEADRVKAVAKHINEKFSDYQTRYPQKDVQDHLAMTLLTITNELKKLENAESANYLAKSLEGIESSISALLK